MTESELNSNLNSSRKLFGDYVRRAQLEPANSIGRRCVTGNHPRGSRHISATAWDRKRCEMIFFSWTQRTNWPNTTSFT